MLPLPTLASHLTSRWQASVDKRIKQQIKAGLCGSTGIGREERYTYKLVANVAGLSVRERVRLMSLLNEFDYIFMTQPGCTKLVRH